MRIAILSDTHLRRFGRVLPPWLVASMEAANVDRILHAGDWTTELAVDLLEALAPVDGVAGNNDGPELHERFGTRRVVEIEGVRIGITHGHLGPGGSTEERARRTFDDEPRLAAIVFGHSHVPLIRRLDDGRWLVNPGSPTDKRRQPYPTWALATIEDGALTTVELVRGPAGPRNALSSPA